MTQFLSLFLLVLTLNACSGAAGPGGMLPDSDGSSVMPPLSIPAPSLIQPDGDRMATAKPDTEGRVMVRGAAGAVNESHRSSPHQIALSTTPVEGSDVCASEGVACCPIEADGSFTCIVAALATDVIYAYLTDGKLLSPPVSSEPDQNLAQAADGAAAWNAAEAPITGGVGLCPSEADAWTWNKAWDEAALVSHDSGVSLCKGEALTRSISIADVDLYQDVKLTSDGHVRFAALVNRSENIREGLLFDTADPTSPIPYLPAAQGDFELVAFDATAEGEAVSVIVRDGRQELIVTEGMESSSRGLSLTGMAGNELSANDLMILPAHLLVRAQNQIFILQRAMLAGTAALALDKKDHAVGFAQEIVDMTLSLDGSRLIVLVGTNVHVLTLQDGTGFLSLDAIRDGRRVIRLKSHLDKYVHMQPVIHRVRTVDETNGRESVQVAVQNLGILAFDVTLAEPDNEVTPEVSAPLVDEAVPVEP